MGQVIHFEEAAVARLRERLGVVEEANQDLIAFARGHSGAVASIHEAALAAVDSTSIEDLLEIVSGRWPAILGVDSVAVALVTGRRGFCARDGRLEQVEAGFVQRMLSPRALVEIRSVSCGHALFGADLCRDIQAEALIRIDSPAPHPFGLLALGQCGRLELDCGHGSELLLFLGQVVASALRRFGDSS